MAFIAVDPVARTAEAAQSSLIDRKGGSERQFMSKIKIEYRGHSFTINLHSR